MQGFHDSGSLQKFLQSESTHLAFVSAIVTFLYIFNLERPIIGALSMKHLKSLVISISEHAGRKNMPIPAAYPRNLKEFS